MAAAQSYTIRILVVVLTILYILHLDTHLTLNQTCDTDKQPSNLDTQNVTTAETIDSESGHRCVRVVRVRICGVS